MPNKTIAMPNIVKNCYRVLEVIKSLNCEFEFKTDQEQNLGRKCQNKIRDLQSKNLI